jgi:hypothetical protein
VTSTFAIACRAGVARAALLALAALAVACTSNVSAPTPVEDPARVTIQPDSAVLYSGIPTTFTVSGGTGTYAISSSNQAVVQVPSFLNGRTFSVTPSNVVADTDVTISVRDSGTAPLATASLTVRPGTVANEITVTPTPTQGGDCAPAVCSGGDAIVFARISQGGNALPARGVRLDVVSGDFRFIVSPPGQPEVLATSTTVVSDQAGGVHARIRALPGAANQTAVVQITDLGTNAFRRTLFTIAQATGSSPGFFTVPESIGFTGPNTLSCATGTRADVSIFGGSPPYTIAGGGSAFGLSHSVVTSSGGSFYVVANGVCAENVPISVVDSAGRTAIVTVSNERGTEAVPDLVVSPSAVTISECGGEASVSVAGGVPGNFTVSSGSSALIVSVAPERGLISIRRAQNAPASTPLSVGVASGDKAASITVNLTGDALNTNCTPSALSVFPSSVTLSGCGFVDVAVSGGQPPYGVLSNHSAVTAAVIGPNLVRVSRVNPSQAATGPASVTIFDSRPPGSRSSREVGVTVTGTCP